MKLLTSTGTKRATISFFLFFSLIFISQSFAQVSIAPTSLFFDSQSRFQSLMVSNGGQQAQEISISTEFGYPTTRNGSLIIVNDSSLATSKSMADWIKIFPQNFTLQPQQRQTVRFVARPHNNLEEGGYWSRVKIQSNPVSPPIESVGENQVGAQINLVVNQVIAAHYRTQNATTGVNVTSVDFKQIDSTQTGQIAVSMEQTGNAPFIGSLNVSVVSNTNGETVYQSNTTNSVYTTITRTFHMDLSDLEPGQYTISGEITSQRRDINQDKLLQIQPVSFQKKITIE
jgi:P pilus assembly chaperone PapD